MIYNKLKIQQRTAARKLLKPKQKPEKKILTSKFRFEVTGLNAKFDHLCSVGCIQQPCIASANQKYT
jgi:hypothetical protein